MTRLTLDSTALDIVSEGKAYIITLDRHTYRLEVVDAAGGRLDLMIDGRPLAAYVSSDGRDCWVTVHGRTFLITKSSGSAPRGSGHDASSELTAPMPGQVRTVNVRAGDAVTKGQVLIVLEAMKMEIRLQAPFDGTVSSVDAQAGQPVEREQILARLQRS